MAAIIQTGVKVSAGQPGGNSSALALTAGALIKTGPGLLFTIVSVGGTALELLDGTTGSGTILYNNAAITAGQVIELGGFPFFSGLYIESLTGAFNLSFS